ncbi:integral membrane protein [Candidatus Hepatincola sp. Av]
MWNIWKEKANLQILIWGTIIGGLISALVKWGGEVIMPARIAGEISPPGAHINAWLGWTGFNQHSLDYVYQGSTILGAVSIYHVLFSVVFTFLYVFVSAYCPKIRALYGAVYGLIVTVFAHGLMIPIFGLRYPVYNPGKVGWLWNLNGYELWSEIIGHILWGISIEICLIAILAYFAKPIKGSWA